MKNDFSSLIPLTEKKTILRDMVVEQIYDLILHGQFNEGRRLPAERVLAARFAVSRHLIREALRILEQRQIVYTKLGSGTYVSTPALTESTKNQPKEQQKLRSNLVEIFEFRRRIEPRIAFLAATNVSIQDKKILKDIVSETYTVVTQLNVIEYYRMDVKFHTGLATMTGNSLYTKTASLLNFSMIAFRDSKHKLLHSRMLASAEAHEKIALSIISGKAKEAESLMEQHIIFTVRNALSELIDNEI